MKFKMTGVLWIALVLVFLFGSVSGDNVETRIHYLMRPSGQDHSEFGTSLIVERNPNIIYAGAPKKTTEGALYKCPFNFNVPANRSNACSSFFTFGSENASTGLTMDKVRVGLNEYVMVCGNQYTFSCPDLEIQQRMTGECYSYSPVNDAKATLPSLCPIGCPTGLVADIVFVVDSSGSVDISDFKLSLSWSTDVLKKFRYDIDKHNIQVGYVVYSDDSDTTKELTASNFYTLKDEINDLAYIGSSTNTAGAIISARSILSRSTRPSAAKVMIIVTDGNSDDRSQTTLQASLARSESITMIAVGVGNGISKLELQLIATGVEGDNTRVMTVTNYKNLNSILEELSQVIKETASTSLEGGVTNSSTELTQCQIGTSIHASQDALYIGATGSYDRTGTVAEYDDLSGFPKTFSTGHLNATELQEILGLDSDAELKDSYFGYSISSGRLTTGNPWIVTSAPRYHSKGMVLIYRKGTSLSHTALHPAEDSDYWQLGGYYGSCVLAMDLDKDGFDDLIVSAPLFSKTAGYDEGVVFVYMNKRTNLGPSRWKNANFKPIVLEGDSIMGARFGYTIVNAGDLTNDGFDELIIGAPSEKSSDDGTGAIYIYFTSMSGVVNARRQKIAGHSVTTQTLSGFGTAMYGGIDFDNNGYSDIAISAPVSDRIVLLRTRQLIAVSVSISASPSVLSVINCVTEPGERCTRITICATAQDVLEPNPSVSYAMNFNLTLDSLIGDISRRRFVFLDLASSVKTITGLQIGVRQTCRNFNIIFKTSTLGILNGGGLEVTPRVDVSVDFSAAHKNQIMSGVMDPTSENTKNVNMTFLKGCSGAGGKCEHDLVIKAVYVLPPMPILLVGEMRKISVNVTIENKGPDYAYFLKVNVTSGSLTPMVLGSCAVLSEAESDSSKGSTVIKYKTSTSLLSDMMLAGEQCNFTIEFNFAKLQSLANNGTFEVKAKIYSNAGGEDVAFDSNLADNTFQFSGTVKYKSVITFDGYSSPEKAFFNSSTNMTIVKTLEDPTLGGNKTNVLHRYTVYNTGPLALTESRIKFSWPEMSASGFPIFYLEKVECAPESACTCSTDGKANKWNIRPKPSSPGSYVKEVRINYPSDEQALTSSSPVTCKNFTCTELYCDLHPLALYQKIAFLAYFKPWVPTFSKYFTEAQIASTFEILPAEHTIPMPVTKKEITTTLTQYDPTIPIPAPSPTNLNIGAIIGGIIGGILLLCIVMLVMWKAGFFKSKYGKMTREARQSVRQAGGAGQDAPDGIESGDIDAGESMPGPSNPELNKSTQVLCD